MASNVYKELTERQASADAPHSIKLLLSQSSNDFFTGLWETQSKGDGVVKKIPDILKAPFKRLLNQWVWEKGFSLSIPSAIYTDKNVMVTGIEEDDTIPTRANTICRLPEGAQVQSERLIPRVARGEFPFSSVHCAFPEQLVLASSPEVTEAVCVSQFFKP